MSASGVARAQRHLFAALDLGKDKLYGHIKPRKNRTRSLEFCRYLRSLCPPEIRIAIVLDNFSPHLTTEKDTRVSDWAAASDVESAARSSGGTRTPPIFACTPSSLGSTSPDT